MGKSHFISSPIDGHWVYFHFGTVVNNAAMNTCITSYVFISPECMPSHWITGSCGLSSTINLKKKTAKLFSRVATIYDIPINNVCRFTVHIHASACYGLSFLNVSIGIDGQWAQYKLGHLFLSEDPISNWQWNFGSVATKTVVFWTRFFLLVLLSYPTQLHGGLYVVLFHYQDNSKQSSKTMYPSILNSTFYCQNATHFVANE